MKVNVRWLIGRDYPEVIDIDRETYGENAWTRRDIKSLMRERSVCGMVAEFSETVCGFVIYDLIPQSIVIVNIGVAADVRRCGIGTLLVNRLQNKLHQQKRKNVSVLVRETNLTAQLFFRGLQFQCDSILRNAYDDDDGSGDAAYRFRYSVADIPATRLDAYWKGSHVDSDQA